MGGMPPRVEIMYSTRRRSTMGLDTHRPSTTASYRPSPAGRMTISLPENGQDVTVEAAGRGTPAGTRGARARRRSASVAKRGVAQPLSR